MMINRVHETVELIINGLNHWLPQKVFVAYSGGKDSAVVVDIMRRLAPKRFVGVMCIDTELSADGWVDMVIEHCSALELPLEIVKGLGWEWYRQNVLDYGFGYTPSQHTVYYRMLKERAVYKHLKSVKSAKRDRVMYVTGVRRAESAKRANAPLWYRRGSRITLNPLINWRDSEIDSYLDVVAKWWVNPFYDTVGTSGDCLCGWTCQNTASEIKAHHPLIGEKLLLLSGDAVRLGMWAYGTRPDNRGQLKNLGGENMPEDSLCNSCALQKGKMS